MQMGSENESLTKPSGFPDSQPEPETNEVTPIWVKRPSAPITLMADPLSPCSFEISSTSRSLKDETIF